MKMDALNSQICYPLGVNSGLRATNSQLSTQKNQIGGFETEIATSNWDGTRNETPPATGQPEEIICTFHERHRRGFADFHHGHHSVDLMNSFNPPIFEENFGKFADSIRSGIDTIPDSGARTAIEGEITNFETSIKETLDNFTNEFRSLVQDQAELFNGAFEQLINAISGYFNNDGVDPTVETADNEDIVDSTDLTATDPQTFKFEEFEINLREKFIAALDEFLKKLKETAWGQEDFAAQANGAAYPSYSENYEQIMAITNSYNHGSGNETFTTLA